MTFSVQWHPKAAKNLEVIPSKFRKQVSELIELVAEAPFAHLEHFEGEYYKLRIGRYRALVDVNFEQRILKVQVFDKRERIY